MKSLHTSPANGSLPARGDVSQAMGGVSPVPRLLKEVDSTWKSSLAEGLASLVWVAVS